MLYGSASVDPSHALGEVVTGCQVGGRLLLMIVDGCLQGQKTAEMLSGGPRAGSGCCAPVDEEDHRIAGSTLDDCRQLLARQFVAKADFGLGRPGVSSGWPGVSFSGQLRDLLDKPTKVIGKSL